MMTLITGSAGHLGEALMRTLRSRSESARGIDLQASPFTDAVGSIRDPNFVREAMDGVDAVIHTATLHKPHIATHSAQAFIDTNVSGTLTLLQAAAERGVSSFVYTSTTSAFGSALTPRRDEPAAWITEEIVPIPRNIYGTSKLMAEQLCELVHRQTGMPLVVLRTSRFFPEVDDDPDVRVRYEAANVLANELAFRRLDLEDAVSAHLLARDRAPRLRLARYVVSATTPFGPQDLQALRQDACFVVRRYFPQLEDIYGRRGWNFFPEIDRVYVNALARQQLGWNPRHDFGSMLQAVMRGEDFRSPLALEVGSKGYHDRVFDADAPYPVAKPPY